ncbi:PREDICTED: uncharacterized protein LOC107335338 isoform X5 [Acropora digitifera]|uniref:uncharacterized protein LOC107335338 isoform X5 n=1 Tax=Acropora digitifera TaxID=70779 RepID=UPI00077A7300|nr:PREDICTED: uncharacterized protein LOC107335338 isoform X5 [Acropora digitifera]
MHSNSHCRVDERSNKLSVRRVEYRGKTLLLENEVRYLLQTFAPTAPMANTQRGNRRFRNKSDPSWYDRSMADNVSARQLYEAMDIPKDKVGLIIGKKGWRLQEIKERSGAHVEIVDDKVHLRGTPEQCERAKNHIEEILNPSTHKEHYGFKLVQNLVVPEESIGHVIGKCRENFNTIETTTGVSLKVRNNEFYIKAASEKTEKLAVRKIKELACIGVLRAQLAAPSTKFAYVDSAQLEENHEIRLAPAQLGFSNSRLGETYYKLQLLDHPLQEETFSGFRNSDGLKEEMLKVLENIYAEKDDQELKVDMWSHFGHAYITKVDEDEVDDTFTLNEVKEKIQNGNGKSWKPFFKEFLGEMEVEAITSLPSRATLEDIRYDFSFYTPSCRNVRVKAWIMKENSGQEGGDAGSSMVFCTTAPTTVRNILTRVKSNEDGAASNKPSFHICYRSHHRMKVDILMPAKGLDCRLSIRTWKNYVPKTPQDEEEDKILESYLMGMKIDGDRLILPPASQLQEGFDLYYHRRSLRKTYHYEMEREQFSLIVCKEQATDVDPCGFDRSNVDKIKEKIDIHLHCDEWDRALEEGNWEPEQIAAKLCNFLQFVRDVQQNVSPKAIRGD